MDLETNIRALLEQRNTGSASERRLAERQLRGLRYSYKDAGPIIEDLDPMEWGGITAPLPAATDRQGKVIRLPHR